jgi:hypothetical protein
MSESDSVDAGDGGDTRVGSALGAIGLGDGLSETLKRRIRRAVEVALLAALVVGTIYWVYLFGTETLAG